MTGPTGFAVVDPAQEVLRFAEEHGITLNKANYERRNAYQKMSYSERLRAILDANSGVQCVSSTNDDTGTAQRQLAQKEQPGTV